jgi:hypothetical protein
MSVAEAQEKIDSQEYASWLAFSRVEPFGEARADLRSAVVAAVVANAHRGKGAKAFTPADFMPQFDPPDETPEQLFAALSAHAQIHNRKLKR